jgi:hypothetical protein
MLTWRCIEALPMIQNPKQDTFAFVGAIESVLKVIALILIFIDIEF